MAYHPWQVPDNPFDYEALVNHSQGIGKIPVKKIGTQIAVIGAGCAGLCAAWELMKIGLHPVIYESDKNPDGTPRIGGRAYTWRFPGDPNALAISRYIPLFFKYGVINSIIFSLGRRGFAPVICVLPVSMSNPFQCRYVWRAKDTLSRKICACSVL